MPEIVTPPASEREWPPVSVIMPVYNAAATIGEQLEALAHQDFAGGWELLIADNGCTDRTRDIAANFADRLPMRVIDASAEKGTALARNTAARACSFFS